MTLGFAPAVRDYLKSLPEGEVFSPAGLAEDLGWGTPMVARIIGDFHKRGEVERVEYGQYRYKGISQLREGAAKVRPRLLRAMHVKTTFTVRELAILADAKADYASKVVRKLREAKEIQRTGERKGLRGQREGVYRVIDRDAFFLKHLASNGGGQRGMKVISGSGAKESEAEIFKRENMRKGLLAKIHCAKRDLGWTDFRYRNFLTVHFGVPTAAALQVAELDRLVEMFINSFGWKPKPSRRDANKDYLTVALRQRAKGLAYRLKDGANRLPGITKKICGVDSVDWCTDDKKLKRLLAVLGDIYRREQEKGE